MSVFDDVFGEYVLEEAGMLQSSSNCYKIDGEESESRVFESEKEHCTENETAPLDDVEYQNRRQELYCLAHWANEAKKQAPTVGDSRLETVTRNYKELQKQFAYLAACYQRVERERDQLRIQIEQEREQLRIQLSEKTTDERVPSTPSLKEDVSAADAFESPPSRAQNRGTKRHNDELVVRSKRLPRSTKKFINL